MAHNIGYKDSCGAIALVDASGEVRETQTLSNAQNTITRTASAVLECVTALNDCTNTLGARETTAIVKGEPVRTQAEGQKLPEESLSSSALKDVRDCLDKGSLLKARGAALKITLEPMKSYALAEVGRKPLSNRKWDKISQSVQNAIHLRKKASKLNPLVVEAVTSRGRLEDLQIKAKSWMDFCDEKTLDLSGMPKSRMRDCRMMSDCVIDELQDVIKNGAKEKTILCASNKKDEIQAIMILVPRDGEMYIEDLVTHPDNILHPNKTKAGSRLIVAACQYASRHGYQSISLAPLTEAITFYQRCGFEGEDYMQLKRSKFAETLNCLG